MKVLILQPTGHNIAHHAYYTRRLADNLADHDAVQHVTVVSYAGFKDEWSDRAGLTLRQAIPERFDVSYGCGDRPQEWVEATRRVVDVGLELAPEHDVVQVLDSRLDTLAWKLWARRRFLRKTVVLWHEIPLSARITSLRDLPGGLRLRARLIRRVMIPERILVGGTTTLVHAEPVAEGIRRWLPRARVAVIPPGSDTSHNALPSRDEARRMLGLDIGDRPALLMFGILGPHKGVHTLLAALQQSPPDLALLMAGPPLQGRDIRGQVGEAGWLDRSVLSLGYVPDAEVELWFRAADAIVLAYPAGFVQNSGVLTRAADFRTPVICCDVGQMGQLTRDYGLGLLFEPENPVSLREAIDQFLALDGEEVNQFREGLMRFADDNSWPSIAHRHVQLYGQVASGQKWETAPT